MGEDFRAQLRQMIHDFEGADSSVWEWMNKFDRRDRTSDELIDEWTGNMIPALKLAVRISGTLADASWSLVDDPQLRRKARTIREKKGYISFEAERAFLSLLDKITGKRYESLLGIDDVVKSLREYLDSDSAEWDIRIIHEILDEAFLGTPADYLLRKLEIGGLIVKNNIKSEVSGIIVDLQGLYVLGQFRAAVVICRTVLEAALRDKLGRKVDSKKVQELDNWSLPRLWKPFERDRRYAHYSDKIKRINREATDTVHARTDAPSRGCLETIKDTLEILESLYEK
ncbi:MAG: hypothetical protein ACE5JS_08400 [Nitrospinota bacterium]